MVVMDPADAVKARFKALEGELNERTRRLWAAAEARALGWGGIQLVARATGISDSTVWRGAKELDEGEPIERGRVRRRGGGRKRVAEQDPTLIPDLESLVEPTAAGHPQCPLRWTSKSVRNLTAALRKMGHDIGIQTVYKTLLELGYRLQGNRREVEGVSHPDRDAQFRYINKCVTGFQRRGQPVISIDCKKKELVGNFKNAGKEWRPEGMPERVKVHDFEIAENGKAIPYGVYDLTKNAGWVSVGIDHETSSFAVQSVRRWWKAMGKPVYPKAKSLLITADGGGSNSPRRALWRWELQKFADETGLSISVVHFPPGTSKWNKIEHRLFSYISANWRGRPLTSLAVIINLIASTRTRTGLRVRAELDTGKYPTGVEVSQDDLATIRLRKHRVHGEWNYTIRPRSRR